MHAEGGTIVVQLWHTGRVSHTSFQKDGQAPVGPSAIQAHTKTFIAGQGFVDCSTPRALNLVEIPGIIADFRFASMRALGRRLRRRGIARRPRISARRLPSQWRQSNRTDAYGGSIENRARLLLEVTEACAKAIGADRLGVRISPVSTAGDSHDSDPQPLFDHVIDRLSPLRLAYVHVVEGETGGARDSLAFDYAALRDRFEGIWMVNNGYDRQMAINAVASGRADLVSFGRLFMANPDLVRRLEENTALNPLMEPSTFYGGGRHGYTDYPTLDQVEKSAMLV